MLVLDKTFQKEHCPITSFSKATFSELFVSRDGKIIKKTIFQTKADWLVWRKSVNEEVIIQKKFCEAFPNHVLTVLDSTIQIVNHKRQLYIAYDCDQSAKPLFQYISENEVSYKEQISICEKLLQIAQILHNSEYNHANLKPNNVIYWNKKVLITDFGSARTHYWNFTKEHTGKKEKEWQNNFLFFCPQQYLEIMQEENIDFRDDQWRRINLNDTQLRKKADIWAIGIMILQVFENNQHLNQDIQYFYGINHEIIQEKLKKLGETQCGLISNAVKSLIIDWQDPEYVLKCFQNQKLLINQNNDHLMTTETTSNFYQIFDTKKDDLTIEPGINQNYFYSKEELEKLRQLHYKDDKSSVRSENTQLIENVKENYQKGREGSLIKPNQLIPFANNELTASQQLQRYNNNQPIEYETTNQKQLQKKEPIIVRTDHTKPSIIITNYEDEKRQIPKLEVVTDKDEFEPIINQFQGSQFEIPHDEQSQGLLQFKDPEAEENEITNKPSQEFFKFEATNKLQIVTDKNNGGIVSFTNIESGKFQLERKIQENSVRLLQVNDNGQVEGGQIDQSNNQQKNQLQIDSGISLVKVQDQAEKQKFISHNNQSKETTTQEQPKPPENLQQLESKDDLQSQQIPDKYEYNYSAQFAKIENLELVQNFQVNSNNNQRTKSPINVYGKHQQDEVLVKVADADSVSNIKPPPPLLIIQSKLQEEENNPLQSMRNVKDDERKTELFNNNNPSVLEIKKNQELAKIADHTQPINKIVPVMNDGPTLNELLKKNDLRNMNEGEIQTHKDLIETISEILNKAAQGDQPIPIINDGKSDNNQQITQIIAEVLSLTPIQQQQKLIEVMEQLDAIKKKQKVDELFDQNQIVNNPDLLNNLSDDQLNKLKDTLKTKKDTSSKMLLEQINQLQKMNEKLKSFTKNPSVSKILKPDELAKLNSEQLAQYKESLIELVKTTKSKQVQNQIFQQQQQIEKIQQKIKLDDIIQKFIDNPKSDTLLPEKELTKLNEEQQRKYKDELERLLKSASGRFKKALEQALIALEKVIKPVNPLPPNLKIIPHNDNSSQGTQPEVTEKDHLLSGGNYSWNDEAKDFEVFSLNKIICAYQKTPNLYTVHQEIPQEFQKTYQNKRDRKKDFYNLNTYGGYWLNGIPHGLGTMMEAKKYGIYKGIFKEGNFMWGQVLELNDKGELIQYIGYYHEKYQVKNARKGEMKWYKYSLKEFQLCESYIGNFLLGYISGKGEKTYADGSVYDGDWKQNKREGEGIYIRQTRGYFKYKGGFKNDLFDGQSVVYFDEMGKLTESGQYQKGKPVGGHELKLDNVPYKIINY